MNNEKKVSIWYVIGNADLGLGKSFDSVEVENLRNEVDLRDQRREENNCWTPP